MPRSGTRLKVLAVKGWQGSTDPRLEFLLKELPVLCSELRNEHHIRTSSLEDLTDEGPTGDILPRTSKPFTANGYTDVICVVPRELTAMEDL